MKKITVIIPALNEERGIGQVLDGIPYKRLAQLGFETRVIVVDNGSTDNTHGVVKSKKVEIVREKKRGKGYALRTGLASLAEDMDYVVIIDADDTYKPKEIPRLIEPLESGFADVIAGSRMSGKLIRGSLTFSHRFANWLFAFMMRHIYQANITDALTGFIAMKKTVVDKLLKHLTGNDFTIEMEFFTKVKKHGFHLYSVPITYDRRLGHSKLNSWRDGFKILRTFVRNLSWRPKVL
ncbi:MAG: glycosyltransferase family 2 protein [Patescibacteria group bacterium]|jgi:glycosyltransferase involved in cell wall biosynthesis